MAGDLWYKTAIVYSLDVSTFMDGNGDGVGDFQGLQRRLDYLAGLGVTCVWLLPFYGSPNRDNGYDVSDYYSIDPRLGDLGDFVEFSHEAKARGIRILTDLVVNHTSDEHPWFQAARNDPRSRYRDYYVWSATQPEDAAQGVVFPGPQKRTWTYDAEANAYYFHRFFSFQPDLNLANPAVREEIAKIMGFWLELGVSGFRIDAVPLLLGIDGPGGKPDDDPYEFLTHLRDFLSWRRGDAILLAEANVPMGDVQHYFEGGRRLQLVFNFAANQALFLAMAEESARALQNVLRDSPRLSEPAQWATFLRNHDELDLGRLSDAERELVFEKFGPEPNMQIFGRGLRRRLAPMLGGDPRRLLLAYSLLLTLPGTPVLWYGEEIGMGEDLALPGRASVRTPMQWSSQRNGGFSTAPREQLVRQPVAHGSYAYERVNAADQRYDPASLQNRLERLIRMRTECSELGWGSWELLSTGSACVLGLRYTWRGRLMVVLHNFAARSQDVTLERDRGGVGQMVDVLTGQLVSTDTARGAKLKLDAYGFRWLRPAPAESAAGEPSSAAS